MGDIISRQWIQGHCIICSEGGGKKRIEKEERKKKRKGKLKD